jgi:hypothetical protein
MLSFADNINDFYIITGEEPPSIFNNTIFDIYTFTESSDIIYVKHQLEIKLNLKVVDYDDDCELAEVICFNRNAALQKLVNDDNVISTKDIEQTDDESLDIIETQDIKRKIFELDI